MFTSKYPGKTINQILALKDVEPMSTKSVNKHVSRLGALLIYCVEEGIITTNPASGLKIAEKKRADEERSSYSKDDVKKIVSAVPKVPSKPERFWIPLIGLYTGMRLNEICQLYVSDVIMFDGLWCFSINAEKDKRLHYVYELTDYKPYQLIPHIQKPNPSYSSTKITAHRTNMEANIWFLVCSLITVSLH